MTTGRWNVHFREKQIKAQTSQDSFNVGGHVITSLQIQIQHYLILTKNQAKKHKNPPRHQTNVLKERQFSSILSGRDFTRVALHLFTAALVGLKVGKSSVMPSFNAACSPALRCAAACCLPFHSLPVHHTQKDKQPITLAHVDQLEPQVQLTWIIIIVVVHFCTTCTEKTFLFH